MLLGCHRVDGPPHAGDGSGVTRRGESEPAREAANAGRGVRQSQLLLLGYRRHRGIVLPLSDAPPHLLMLLLLMRVRTGQKQVLPLQPLRRELLKLLLRLLLLIILLDGIALIPHHPSLMLLNRH